jgi:hypothetical protein
MGGEGEKDPPRPTTAEAPATEPSFRSPVAASAPPPPPEASAVRIVPQLAAHAPEGWVLCTHCRAYTPTARYCSACGLAIGPLRLCIKCGFRHGPKAKFCENCGEKA